jgi:hypothetical protein
MRERIEGTAEPGSVWCEGCTCRAVLLDYVRATVGHPYYGCRYYGLLTPLAHHEHSDG